MKTWMSLVLLLLSACTAEAAVYPTLLAVAKHPVGGGRYMLVVPGYRGLPVFVDREDRVTVMPEQIIAAPTTWTRLADGSMLYSPQATLPSVIINPQPAFIVLPQRLRTGWDGPAGAP